MAVNYEKKVLWNRPQMDKRSVQYLGICNNQNAKVSLIFCQKLNEFTNQANFRKYGHVAVNVDYDGNAKKFPLPMYRHYT